MESSHFFCFIIFAVKFGDKNLINNRFLYLQTLRYDSIYWLPPNLYIFIRNKLNHNHLKVNLNHINIHIL